MVLSLYKSSEFEKLHFFKIHYFSERATQNVTIFRFRTLLVCRGKKIFSPFSKVISKSIQETFKQM